MIRDGGLLDKEEKKPYTPPEWEMPKSSSKGSGGSSKGSGGSSKGSGGSSKGSGAGVLPVYQGQEEEGGGGGGGYTAYSPWRGPLFQKQNQAKIQKSAPIFTGPTNGLPLYNPNSQTFFGSKFDTGQPNNMPSYTEFMQKPLAKTIALRWNALPGANLPQNSAHAGYNPIAMKNIPTFVKSTDYDQGYWLPGKPTRYYYGDATEGWTQGGQSMSPRTKPGGTYLEPDYENAFTSRYMFQRALYDPEGTNKHNIGYDLSPATKKALAQKYMGFGSPAQGMAMVKAAGSGTGSASGDNSWYGPRYMGGWGGWYDGGGYNYTPQPDPAYNWMMGLLNWRI